MSSSLNSFDSRRKLQVQDKVYEYYSLQAAADHGLPRPDQLPRSLKILLENLLRREDGRSVTRAQIESVVKWLETKRSDVEIAFQPARVLMQDFTGVPAVADLAAMRQAMADMKKDPSRINPLSQVDLVIDHSVMVDEFGTELAFQHNVAREFERNAERYAFLRWAQQSFENFRVVPPGTGICHQVNLEYLAQTVWQSQDPQDPQAILVHPDTLVGTDSHTTMVNGLSVLGWGVGGIEAEAVMLGQPISMVIPEVIGFKLSGNLPEGATATDLVLAVTHILRKQGVVGKFVEFYGPGLQHLSLADRATIANMAPEYGATCGFFPIDRETVNYLSFTGRDPDVVALVEAYAKEQGLWLEPDDADPVFTDVVELNLADIEPSLAGPKRPQDKISLKEAAQSFSKHLDKEVSGKGENSAVPVEGDAYSLDHGDVVIAAITSCTNTSNPSVMLAAGLVARKARERGLQVKPWVKTSLSPGSQVVSDYLAAAGLQDDLDALGFQLTGYGCMTCIGNSGPLPAPIASAIETGNLLTCSVLSGNRNFEGRVNPHVRANYLASPPLVVAYALAGSMKIDITKEAIGKDQSGQPVFLKDIWPSTEEIKALVQKNVTKEMFTKRYAQVFDGPEEWKTIPTASGLTYKWQAESTYVKMPPFFEDMAPEPPLLQNVHQARALALLGDSVTTDHISPAGAIKTSSPAGVYLTERGVDPRDFNSYGARRGNHEVMMRGTFANIRIRNLLTPDIEGGVTRHIPSGEQMSIYDAAMRYATESVPLLIFAGREYGTGSSRDWAAKGTQLLGVRAVIAQSFERIHRSNLIGMGVLPLQFRDGMSWQDLNLDGSQKFDVLGIESDMTPRQDVRLLIHHQSGDSQEISLLSRVDTLDELAYLRNGGILHYVLRRMSAEA